MSETLGQRNARRVERQKRIFSSGNSILVEEIAKAICGKELSKRIPPLWTEYIPEAERVIEVIRSHIREAKH